MENKSPNQTPSSKPTSKFPKFNISWIYGIIILVLLGSYLFQENTQTKDINFTTFKEYVKNGMIVKVDIYSSKGAAEAQLVDYTKMSIDTVTLRKVFGENYKSIAYNPKLLRDSLKRRDTQMLKNVYGEKFESYAKDRLITVSAPADGLSRFLDSSEEKYGYAVAVDYKDSRNYMDLFLYSILPILLLVILMKRLQKRWLKNTLVH